MKREVIKSERAPKAIGPYEQALKLDGPSATTSVSLGS